MGCGMNKQMQAHMVKYFKSKGKTRNLLGLDVDRDGELQPQPKLVILQHGIEVFKQPIGGFKEIPEDKKDTADDVQQNKDLAPV